LLVLILTFAEDGLFCYDDYKNYLGNYNMDLSGAQEHFKTLLTVTLTFLEDLLALMMRVI
jgi:hypothetical protein